MKSKATESFDSVAANGPAEEKMCTCCGQMRPYPLLPGEWEFLENPYIAEHFAAVEGKEPVWQPVTVKRGEEGLTITLLGKKKPIWWPNNAAWRKRGVAAPVVSVAAEAEAGVDAKLPSCPFCGSGDGIQALQDDYTDLWQICCECCGASGGSSPDRIAAVALWGRRADGVR